MPETQVQYFLLFLLKMLIMITMDKTFRDTNYNIILQCNCTVTVIVHVISRLSLKNLRDYFSDIIRTICMSSLT